MDRIDNSFQDLRKLTHVAGYMACIQYYLPDNANLESSSCTSMCCSVRRGRSRFLKMGGTTRPVIIVDVGLASIFITHSV